jgi:hypothetical protein
MFLDALSKKWREGGRQSKYTPAMGWCMRVCRPPHLRGIKKFPAEALHAAPY